jgi:hypothetical protein
MEGRGTWRLSELDLHFLLFTPMWGGRNGLSKALCEDDESSLFFYLDIWGSYIRGANSGMQISLIDLDAKHEAIKYEDEAITVSNAFLGTVEAKAKVDEKSIIVDVDPDTYTLDPRQLDQVFTLHTPAVLPFIYTAILPKCSLCWRLSVRTGHVLSRMPSRRIMLPTMDSELEDLETSTVLDSTTVSFREPIVSQACVSLLTMPLLRTCSMLCDHGSRVRY